MSKGFFRTIVRRIQHGRWLAIKMYGEYEMHRAEGRTYNEAYYNLRARPIPDIKKIENQRLKNNHKT